MLIGYARVSTQEQETHLQLDALKKAGCEAIYEEKRSGGDRTRPILKKVMNSLRPGDTLMVFKLDRVARSLVHLLEILRVIEERGAAFQSLTETIETRSPAGRLMMQIIGAFAEFEREMIRERTRAGMAAAVRRGARLGRPYGIPEEKQPEMLGFWYSGNYTKTALANFYGVHISSVKRVIKRDQEQKQPQLRLVA